MRLLLWPSTMALCLLTGWSRADELAPEAPPVEPEVPWIPADPLRPAPVDARVPSGATLGVAGLLMIGAGISNYVDADGQDFGASLSVGSIIGGSMALVGGGTLLTYAGLEGADTPRKSYRQVMAGQILTGLGFAFTSMLSISILHAHYEDEGGHFYAYIGQLPAGGAMITGASLWLAGARDMPLERGEPRRAVMRSPTMALFGGAMTLTGIAGCAASIAVLSDPEQPNAAVAGTLAALGSTTAAFGVTLLTFGVSDLQIPSRLPELSAGLGSASLRFALD